MGDYIAQFCLVYCRDQKTPRLLNNFKSLIKQERCFRLHRVIFAGVAKSVTDGLRVGEGR